MAEYKKLYADAPPVVAIVTDFAVHGFWVHENIDRYVIATDALRASLTTRGVRESSIFATGIPVRSEFAQDSETHDALRERLDLPRDRHVVLLMGGGLGIAPVEQILNALRSVRAPLAAVAIAGNKCADRAPA